MRTLASLEHYVVLSNDDEVRVHQYVSGVYAAAVAAGEVTLQVETEYPWEGRVRIVVESVPGGRWALGVRVPHWADGATVQVNGQPVTETPTDGWLAVDREWSAGDELLLELPLDVRFTRADSRVDVDRGAVAIERGPLVYCLEAVDNPGQRLDDVIVDTSSAPAADRDTALLGGVTTIRAQGVRRSRSDGSWWPYASVAATGGDAAADAEGVALTAVPYFVWGNRDEGAMRVWIPAE